MALTFTKWQGCGNDFVLVDGRASGLPRDAAGLSRRVCDRHYGIGADGSGKKTAGNRFAILEIIYRRDDVYGYGKITCDLHGLCLP